MRSSTSRSSRSANRRSRRPGSTRRTRTSIWRRSPTSIGSPGSASPAARRPQPARVADGPFQRASRRADSSSVTPPAGVDADARDAAGGARCRPGSRAARMGSVRAAAAARARADRRRADVSTMAPTASTSGRPLRDRAHARLVRRHDAWGDESSFQFHVTSRDWQESDQVLAGILTDFGARTGPVPSAGAANSTAR